MIGSSKAKAKVSYIVNGPLVLFGHSTTGVIKAFKVERFEFLITFLFLNSQNVLFQFFTN